MLKNNKNVPFESEFSTPVVTAGSLAPIPQQMQYGTFIDVSSDKKCCHHFGYVRKMWQCDVVVADAVKTSSF